MRDGLPILLDVSDRSIVIVGGGAVAVRKARGALAAGATRVRAVAPEFHHDMPDDVGCVAEKYHERHLDGATLVFAATDSPEVNARVVQDSRRRGIFVNRADDDAPDGAAGDFTSPAVHRDGAVTVAVSAGSAALSAAIRDGVAARFDPRWTRMAEAMRVLRPRIRDDARLAPAQRHTIFHDLATADALTVIAEGGPDELWRWLVARHPELGSEVP